jgi:hypothetical protein
VTLLVARRERLWRTSRSTTEAFQYQNRLLSSCSAPVSSARALGATASVVATKTTTSHREFAIQEGGDSGDRNEENPEGEFDER